MFVQKDFIIRPLDAAKPSDYESLASLYRYAYPEEPVTPFELKMSDLLNASDLTGNRRFAEKDGRIVGVGAFEHWESFYHPHKYLLHIIVAPQFQGENIGRTLFTETINHIETLDPVEVQCWVQTDRERSIRFAESCGFEKMKLKHNLALDINSFDAARFAAQTDAVREQNVEIKSFPELAGDPDRDRKFYELYIKTVASIDSAGEPQIPAFDEWVVKKNQNAFEMTFVAVREGEYSGMWQIETGAGTSLFGGAMGVDESFRGSGISYALAVRGIEYAKSCKYDRMTAHTDEHNRAVLKLTERLGFVRSSAQYLYGKRYRQG